MTAVPQPAPPPVEPAPLAALREPPVDIGREQARAEAERELLRPGYQQEPPVDRLWRKVTEFLGDLLDGVGTSTGGVISLVVITALLAVLTALLVWALRRMSRAGRTRGMGEPRPERTATEHRAAAQRHAAEGNWREAIQERLRAIARDLEERAIVSPLPGRTAMELAETAGRALPSHAAALREAARVFDDVTYGAAPGSRDAYLMLTGLDERLRTAGVTPEVAS